MPNGVWAETTLMMPGAVFWATPSICFVPLPVATCELLHTCLIQQHIWYPSKHLLAKVLATA